MSDRAIRLLLIGPPGVGKGTQAALLKDRFGATPIASGDIFRYELRNNTELGKIAQQYMERGELVPDEVTIGMMVKHLQTDEVRENGFILDGFPRTVDQALALETELHVMGTPLDRVISIAVDDEVVVERLSGRLVCPQCGATFHKVHHQPKSDGICDNCSAELYVRKDDHPDTIRERLRVFKESTAPVVEHYASKGALLYIDGSKAPEAVFEDIVAGLTRARR